MIILTVALVLLSLVAVSLRVFLKLLGTVPVQGKTNVPGLPGGTWPIIGDSLWFVGIRSPSDMWSTLKTLCQMGDRAISFRLGPRLGICIKDAKILESLLVSSKCLRKDDFVYEPFNMFLCGMFTKNGKEWSDLRKPVNKFMHPTSIQEYSKVFAAKSTDLCQILDEKCGNGAINFHDYVKYCTVDIVLETVLGAPSTQMMKNTLDLPNTMHRAIYLVYQRMVRMEFRFNWIFNLFGPGKSVKVVNSQLGQTLSYILENRKKDHAKKGVSPYDPDFEPENYSDALIQLINNDKLPPTDEKYTALIDVILGGYDSTSITVSTACLFLAMHPDYQEKLYREQVDIMGDSLEPPTAEQVSKMSYLTMVFQEVVRKVGVPGVVRVVNSKIDVEGYVFPVGSILYFSLHEITNDPKHWERPSEFYPDHFLPEFTAKRPKGAFLPFGSGPRSCPGKHFATCSIKIMLSMLFRRFRFTTPLKYDELTFDHAIMVESTKGYPVELTRRIK